MNRIRSYLPLAITLVGGLVIILLALMKLVAEPAGPGKILACLTVLLYFSWKVLESKITVAEASLGDNHDKGTVELCAAVEIGLLASVFLKSAPVWFPVASVGLALMAAGLVIRFTAIAALGESYSLRIRSIKGPVVAVGPYRWVRHPSYLGTLIVHTGLVFVFPGVLPFVFLGLWYLAVTVRARTEDRFLMADDRYVIYSTQTTRMMFPGIK